MEMNTFNTVLKFVTIIMIHLLSYKYRKVQKRKGKKYIKGSKLGNITNLIGFKINGKFTSTNNKNLHCIL